MVETNNNNKVEEFKRETTILADALEDIRTKLKNMGDELAKMSEHFDSIDDIHEAL